MTRPFVTLAVLAPVLFAMAAAAGDQPVPATVSDQPVVVELFTSQGCSSCPPAEALLAELAKRHDVLPLAFHVDYWDYIGWKDPFGSAAATDRQQSYSHALGLNMVYTPEMVIDGTHDAVGSDQAAVMAAIASAATQPKLKLDVMRDDQGKYKIDIPAGDPGKEPATVWLALFDHAHKTEVERGENAGRTLVEYNIVREWHKIGVWDGKPTQIALNLTPESDEYDACAVLVQLGGNGPIRGAASFRMEKNGEGQGEPAEPSGGGTSG
jgi:hypothetical protein